MSLESLLNTMDETRASHLAMLQNLTLTEVIHPDSGWRAQDLVAHVTYWEEQVVLTIEYHQRGERYFLPDFRELGTDGFNHRDYERHKGDSVEMVLENWDAVRQRLKAVLITIPPDQWEQPIKWLGSPVDPETMVRSIVSHEHMHMEQIRNAVSAH